MFARSCQHVFHPFLLIWQEHQLATNHRSHHAAECDVDVVREDPAGVDSSPEIYRIGDHCSVNGVHCCGGHMRKSSGEHPRPG